MQHDPPKPVSPPSDVQLASETREGDRDLPSQGPSAMPDDSLDVETGAAPSFPAPLRPPPAPHRVSCDATVPFAAGQRRPGDVMDRGDRIDDFEVEAVLGRGAFGVVYLARQISLDRRVALKVAANTGSEGRTMARLEHQHIVQVFSETVDPSGRLRLLCMQLVPGAALDNVIYDLTAIRKVRGSWNGADVLASVDGRSRVADVFDPSALHDREALAAMDDLEAACWIGARLAEGVDFAHKQGVLHRDIKPANVLMNRYGRPLLADFNISFQSADTQASVGDRFGGTLAYMSPEHLDAFHPGTSTPPEVVDERSDIYSLGIVLHELLTGEFPLASPPRSDNPVKNLERYAAVRSLAAPEVIAGPGDARKAFSYIVSRCLEPLPENRFATGAELAVALDGCRQLRGQERKARNSGRMLTAIQRHPVRWVILLALLPQVLGSLFNISYNLLEIVTRLDLAQQSLFQELVLGYNVVVYPAAVAAGAWLLLPLARVWRQLEGTKPVDAERLAWARRRALNLPMWLLAIAALGWLPGGVIFPLLLDRFTGPLPASLYGHFIASFTISGLIAVAYSLCGVEFASIRGLYMRMWPRAEGFSETAGRELGAIRWRLGLMLALAICIPLLAAILLLGSLYFAPEVPDAWFVSLTVGLILAGGVGLLVMFPFAGRMGRSIDKLTTSGQV